MDQWGPFAPGLDACERRARLRSLRAIVRLHLGPRGDALARMLECAEALPELLVSAVEAINRLASLDRRRVLASYAGLTKPAAPCAA